MATVDELNIQEADLRHLRSSIDEEIEQVKLVLDSCVEACNEYPSDDDFFKAVEATGQTLDESWNTLINTFKNVGGELDKLIAGVGEKLAKAIEGIKNIVN